MTIRERLTPGSTVAGNSTEAIGAQVEDMMSAPDVKCMPDDAKGLVVDAALEALWRSDRGMPLSTSQRFSLEALVLVNGRPALPTYDGYVDISSSEAKDWGGEINDAKEVMKRVIDSVGRIDLAGVHVGTGFLIAPGFVLTNRHVAEVLGKAYGIMGRDIWLMKAGGVTIDFARELNNDRMRRFKITGILRAGPDAINMTVDLSHLDVAILGIEMTGLDAGPAPEPIPLMRRDNPDIAAAGHIFSVGYPSTPQFEPQGESVNEEERNVLDAIKRIFNFKYGYKRLSPGKVLSRVGRMADSGNDWTFSHDATTLFGASGSLVMRSAGKHSSAIGLHIGGEWLKYNFAHSLQRIPDAFFEGVALNWADN